MAFLPFLQLRIPKSVTSAGYRRVLPAGGHEGGEAREAAFLAGFGAVGEEITHLAATSDTPPASYELSGRKIATE